jgi:hypothetical protein|eukprot:COSAG02_NODE_2130_length_9732_cov_4.306031_6_plen_62_part_00
MMKSLSFVLFVGALSGARAELQMIKGGDMCVGYDDASDDFKIYYVRLHPRFPEIPLLAPLS